MCSRPRGAIAAPRLPPQRIQPRLYRVAERTGEEQGCGAVAHEGAAEVVHGLLSVGADNRERAVLVPLVKVALRILANRRGQCSAKGRERRAAKSVGHILLRRDR
eukprot:770860-Pyramimonas_sp.AAC.1